MDTTPSTPRPFRILGLQQVAIGGPDKQALLGLWSTLFGIPVVKHFASERENVDEAVLSLGVGLYAVEVDLMQPLDPGRKPRVDEPPLNHLGLWVDDLPAAVTWLTAAGVRMAPGGIRPGASGHDICFIHPKGNDASPRSGLGVLIELVQAPPEVINALTSAQG